MDGRPKRRNKAAFSDSSDVVWRGVKTGSKRVLYINKTSVEFVQK